jgi:hypothetical protein
MENNFDENKFINDIVSEYINNDITVFNENFSKTFDTHFDNMTKLYDCKTILNNYCNKNDIDDAKSRFKENYAEIKLCLILYNKFMSVLETKKLK